MEDVQGASNDSTEEFAISEELIQSPTHKHANTSVIDFDGLLTTPLSLHEDLTEGCGGQLWPAGMVLARYMLQQNKDAYIAGLSAHLRIDLPDKVLTIEGSLAIATGCNFQEPLYITDQKPMLALMQQNVRLNNLDACVLPAVLDWGEPIRSTIPVHPDVLLAADCVYFEPAFPLLQNTLCQLIGPKTTCYFCFKKRRRADLQFMKAARKMFNVREITDDLNKEAYKKENIFLYDARTKFIS
ncbi:MAG: hypothetical protein M1836_001585 [Candelina mexicana]|nr:MAG: hypothetical protein M1836_001585 [Candelina mexicana]